MESKKCKLCLNEKSLKKSHAIGNSVFKKIFRQNSGNGILISTGTEDIAYTSDSWAEHQLCNDCEQHLNECYEKYSLEVLRGRNIRITTSTLGIHFCDINTHKLIMYFLSIYWRAANSDHPSYKNVLLTSSFNEYLRRAILENSKIRANFLSIKLYRIIDDSGSKTFSDAVLKSMVFSPFSRIPKKNEPIHNIPVCFIFEGFLIEIYLGGLKLKKRYSLDVISEKKSVCLAKYKNIFDIPEAFELLAKGYEKHHSGKTKVHADSE